MIDFDAAGEAHYGKAEWEAMQAERAAAEREFVRHERLGERLERAPCPECGKRGYHGVGCPEGV